MVSRAIASCTNRCVAFLQVARQPWRTLICHAQTRLLQTISRCLRALDPLLMPLVINEMQAEVLVATPAYAAGDIETALSEVLQWYTVLRKFPAQLSAATTANFHSYSCSCCLTLQGCNPAMMAG